MLLLYFCRLCLLSKLPSVSSTHNRIGHLPRVNWAKYLEIITSVRPFTKLFCKTCKNGGSLPATAAAATPCLPAAACVACTHTHIYSWLQCALHTHTAQAGVALRMGWSCVWNKHQCTAVAAVFHTKGVNVHFACVL